MILPNPSLILPEPRRLDAKTVGRHFTRNAMAEGRGYARDARVRIVDISAEDVIEAETRGSSRKPYRQRIGFAESAQGTIIDGTCSCPVGHNCKHVAAVLFAAGRMPHGEATPPRFLPPPPPAPPLVPHAVTTWLTALEGAEAAGSDSYPDALRQRLYYVLDAIGPPGGAALLIGCVSVTLRKDGSQGQVRPYAPRAVHTPGKHLRPADLLILRRLDRMRYGSQTLDCDEDPPDLLRRIIATGRAHWGALGGPALREGAAVAGRIAWRVHSDGDQSAILALDDGLLPLRLPLPGYADPTTGAIGQVDCGLPPRVAQHLLEAPPIPADAVPEVVAQLAARLPRLAVPPPAELDPPEMLRGPVVPQLRLTLGHLPYDPAAAVRRHAHGGVPVKLVELAFGYGPMRIPAGRRDAPLTLAQEGKRYRLEARDLAGERAAVARLGGIGFARVGDIVHAYPPSPHAGAFVLEDDQNGADWIGVLLHEIPALQADGWGVEVAADFPLRLAQPEGDIEARLDESSGIDWLDLHLGVMVDGEQVDLVPTLLKLIAGTPDMAAIAEADAAAAFLVPLPDGRMLTLPLGRIRPILLALFELLAGGVIDAEEGRLRFSRLDAGELARLEEGSGLVWQGGEAVRLLGRQLRDAGGQIPAVTLPDTFRGTLRPYQAEGVAWLQFLAVAGLGGILADDMGLGKTVQTLAHLAVEQAAGRLDRPALIVCPTSLVPNWRLEAERFAPGLRLLALHGPLRRERFGEIAAHDLVLSTYPLLARDHAVLTAQDWHSVILDEAQTIKNPNAETTRQALRLRAGQRLCLSGTPLQNHLGELWSLFDFLAPGFLGSARDFRSRYRTPIEKHGDELRQAALHRRVRPFLLRRTKDAVAGDLPPKTEITEPVELGPAQRGVYDGIRLAMHMRVKTAIAERGMARSGIIILDALLKLRQACCDPRLLKLKAAHQNVGSAKLDRLMDLLDVLLAEGRRVLLFSQFTSMLALIEARLREQGTAYVLLTGDTTDRTTPVREFQTGTVPVFLISLKAGGVGLNLTAADTVIHYDPWWNPAVEDQATDRAHRIGQDKRVFVHRLVTLGTIEEKMETLKDRKRALVASVLDAEHGGALKLTEADVEELFAEA